MCKPRNAYGKKSIPSALVLEQLNLRMQRSQFGAHKKKRRLGKTMFVRRQPDIKPCAASDALYMCVCVYVQSEWDSLR